MIRNPMLRDSSPWIAMMSMVIATITANASAAVVNLSPSRDTSIFSESDNAASGHDVIYAGRNNSGNLRRALLAFDVHAHVPAGATVNSVALTLHVDNVNLTGNRTVGLSRIMAAWGAAAVGSGGAGGGGGTGVSPVPGVATWNYRFYPESGQTWSSPGGDFLSPSDSLTFAPTTDPANNFFTWSGVGLVADVQYWLAHPDQNFGWMLSGVEAGNTLVRFDSSERAVAAYTPRLTMEYTAVPEPHACCAVVALVGVGGLVRAWSRATKRRER